MFTTIKNFLTRRSFEKPLCPASIVMVPSGKRNNLLDPNDVPDIGDIAWHLSRLNRFTGGILCAQYSVAEHCVRVSRLCHSHPLEALMHDSAEACYGDMNSPLKSSGLMENYVSLENRRLEETFRSLGLEWPLPESVHYWDKYVGTVEYAILVKGTTANIPDTEGPWVTLGPLGWDPLTARTRFLARFEALMRQRAESGKAL